MARIRTTLLRAAILGGPVVLSACGAASTPPPTAAPQAATSTPTPVLVTGEFFDDFSYSGPTDANLTGWWTVRDQGAGGPGPSNCSSQAGWSRNNVGFVADPANGANRLLRLTTVTKGTCADTLQAEINTNAIKFLSGTYAARVLLRNAPSAGTLGDNQINETFFAISDYGATSGTNVYSELDFTEYLPNGGWGNPVGTPEDWFTSWFNDGANDSVTTGAQRDFGGWHTIVCVVSNGQMQYSVDGVLLATHGGKYYPRSSMAIDFNLWWVTIGGSAATYTEDVDWVYYAKDTVLSTSQVISIVAEYQAQGVTRKDTVP